MAARAIRRTPAGHRRGGGVRCAADDRIVVPAVDQHGHRGRRQHRDHRLGRDHRQQRDRRDEPQRGAGRRRHLPAGVDRGHLRGHRADRRHRHRQRRRRCPPASGHRAVLVLCGLAGVGWGLFRGFDPGDAGVFEAGDAAAGIGPWLTALGGVLVLAAAVAIFVGVIDPPRAGDRSTRDSAALNRESAALPARGRRHPSSPHQSPHVVMPAHHIGSYLSTIKDRPRSGRRDQPGRQ